METFAANRDGVVASSAATIESSASAVSWPAIFAGALAAAAASLILLAVGSGMGLASVSPWHGAGASATTFTVMTAMWLIVVQWVASGLGGYLTGRLRTKWTSVHTHEVFFRDTAHGFVTWAVATVLTATVLASAVSSAVGTGVEAATTVAAGAAQGATTAAANAVGSSVTGYDIDRLFRAGTPTANAGAGGATAATPGPNAGTASSNAGGQGAQGAAAAAGASNTSGAAPADTRGEATRILTKALADGELASADRIYLAQSIAARTGISQQDAEMRLDDVTAQIKAADTKARQAADAARKAAALASLYLALSLLIGAFIASAAAALGGQQRDEQP